MPSSGFPDLIREMREDIKQLDKRITQLEATLQAEIRASKEVHALLVKFIAHGHK